MHRTDRRAERAAVIGLCLQVVLSALVLVLFNYNKSAATLAAGMHLLGGIGIWFLIVVELYQSRLAWQQRQEVEQLGRERRERLGGSESVFTSLSADEVLPMERRLDLVKRWFVPIFALINAVILVLLAARLTASWWPMPWLTDAMETEVRGQPVTLMILFGIFLIGFVMSRYVLGLSKSGGWLLLRAGANYFMGNAVVSFALAVTLALSSYALPGPERVLARIIPIIMLILAGEIVLNLVLDMYRPRIPGEEYRPVYESRLLGLLSEPEGVMRSIAQTIDYQFGFKVSETWFYQLLQRAVAPLVLYGAIVLYLVSCFVVVQPGQQAVILRFGKISESRIKGSGLHLKWPWPIDTCRIYPVDQVQTLAIGYTGEGVWDKPGRTDPVLWTVKHVSEEGEELPLLVAAEHTPGQRVPLIGREQAGENAAQRKGLALKPVNILAGAIIITYQVDGDGLLDYVTHYKSPKIILEAIAYRQWTQYMASVDPLKVMTVGRGAATGALRGSIQAECNRRRLGLNILRVGLLGLHPPVDVAKSYEAAINARQERETLIWQARGDANETVPLARAEASETVSAAAADRYGKVCVEQAKAKRFDAQLLGYRAAPGVFKLRHFLDVFSSATEHVRKYVNTLGDADKKILLIINDEEKLPPGLLGVGRDITEALEEKQGK